MPCLLYHLLQEPQEADDANVTVTGPPHDSDCTHSHSLTQELVSSTNPILYLCLHSLIITLGLFHCYNAQEGTVSPEVTKLSAVSAVTCPPGSYMYASLSCHPTPVGGP